MLLKSSLGEFYVNWDRKKGKLQYLNMEKELLKEEKSTTEIIRELKVNEQGLMEKINELTKEIQEMKQKIGSLITPDKRVKRKERMKEITCYNCNEKGHIRPRCPRKKVLAN